MGKVYQAIASKIDGMRRCNARGNFIWLDKHDESIHQIIRDYLPSGSGFDSGTQIDTSEHVGSKADRLVFTTSFHHMNDCGTYDGWTEHKIIVTPSLAYGFSIKVTGRNRHGIKEYIANMFHAALGSEMAVGA